MTCSLAPYPPVSPVILSRCSCSRIVCTKWSPKTPLRIISLCVRQSMLRSTKRDFSETNNVPLYCLYLPYVLPIAFHTQTDIFKQKSEISR
ncbi:hypothetical protein GHT06_018167 [Daphnia sinensis]|uniref:Uncharacterized protein n=1 Tax=Daphnia sinensis TaxID=1820382 RepID=A0AAD5KNE4_9CRUS|nr:hypothetical protein GHT06_018167 [Daphnia sinensis]